MRFGACVYLLGCLSAPPPCVTGGPPAAEIAPCLSNQWVHVQIAVADIRGCEAVSSTDPVQLALLILCTSLITPSFSGTMTIATQCKAYLIVPPVQFKWRVSFLFGGLCWKICPALTPQDHRGASFRPTEDIVLKSPVSLSVTYLPSALSPWAEKSRLLYWKVLHSSSSVCPSPERNLKLKRCIQSCSDGCIRSSLFLNYLFMSFIDSLFVCMPWHSCGGVCRVRPRDQTRVAGLGASAFARRTVSLYTAEMVYLVNPSEDFFSPL